MRTGIRTRSAHDDNARGDELVLHILVDDVVHQSPDIPHAKQTKKSIINLRERIKGAKY